MYQGETTSVREFTVENYLFTAVCKDPCGFWTVKLNTQGKATPQPEEMKGVYFTSLTEAQKAIDAAVAKKTNKDPKNFKKTVVNPLQDKE